jgi:hypothetical protein
MSEWAISIVVVIVGGVVVVGAVVSVVVGILGRRRTVVSRSHEYVSDGRDQCLGRMGVENWGTEDDMSRSQSTHVKAHRTQGRILFVCARLIGAALLIWAYGRHRYIFYQLVKLVVVGVTVYGAFYAHTLKAKTWMVVFVIIAVLFNPFVPVHLNRHTWEVFDLAGAAILVVSIFLLKPASKDHLK